MSGSINIDRLADEVVKALEDFRDVTVDVMKDAVDRTAKETVEDIRGNVDASGIKGGGKYRKSWAAKKDAGARGRYAYAKVVYAKDPHYRLTHLLEHGHAKIGGGRVPAYPHVKAAEDSAQERLAQYIKDGIERGG